MSLLAVGSGKFTYISYIIRCHPPEDT